MNSTNSDLLMWNPGQPISPAGHVCSSSLIKRRNCALKDTPWPWDELSGVCMHWKQHTHTHTHGPIKPIQMLQKHLKCTSTLTRKTETHLTSKVRQIWYFWSNSHIYMWLRWPNAFCSRCMSSEGHKQMIMAASS